MTCVVRVSGHDVHSGIATSANLENLDDGMQTKKLHFGPLKNSKPFLTMHKTMHAADIDFYRGYDPQFLAKKATILYGIYTNLSAFKESSQSWGVRFDSTDADISNVVATELHNASFHQAEAMIAFLLCEFENLPD